MKRTLFTTLFAALLLIADASAQVFGQNKPRYRAFDFNVLETPHFSIHYYTKNAAVLNQMADWTEQWYGLHTKIFKDSFDAKNPVIFYNNHAEFQQTNAIFGDIGIGTGGVTEGFKNRVILPFTMINQQTQQVLGHELVHAFQYHTVIHGDSTSLESLGNIPLWMVEGMAEYVSMGRYDTYTSMWMRDAVLNDDVPNVKKLSSYKYFPYRYGQAFWAYFSGTYGDDLIDPLFTNTAKYGFDVALNVTLGTTQDELGSHFTESLKTYYAPFLGTAMKENFIGKKIISEENAGRLNVSPVVSPDGKWVIFLSDKNLFSTDLYLADARTGKIKRKINSLLRDSHVDDYSFFESSGTWSPDSRQFAFVAYIKGRNVLLIKDPNTGGTKEEIKLDQVSAIAHPSWSPNGKEIAFTGMIEGQTDLFVYNLSTKELRQLTNDLYSEVYPDYSPDGNHLVFSSDRKTFNQEKVHGKWNLHLSRLDLNTNAIEDYDNIFPGADCINPCYDPAGKVYFVSDRDGYRNMYRFDFGNELLQMTDLKTGISGIGRYSPAISVSKDNDRISYTHFFHNGYDIYQTKADNLLAKPVSATDVHFEAGTLPVILDNMHQVVDNNIESLDDKVNVMDEYHNRPYKGKFRLDYIDSGGFGVSTGGIGARTGLAGGVNMIFSDILGNNQLYTTLALNGEIYDVGGAVQYINQKHQLGWGFGVSHIPARFSFLDQNLYPDSLDGYPVFRLDEYVFRLFEDQASALLQYPFSRYLRLEGNLGINVRSFRLDSTAIYYDQNGFYITESRRNRIDENSIDLGFEVRKSVYYNQNIALVGDNSQFGLASPVNGYRYRLDFTNYVGGYEFQTATADLRFYQYVKPVTFAFRALHYSTLGRDSRSFYPISVGEMGLVHGFNYGRLREIQEETGIQSQQLQGSKLIVSSFEVRLPFTGPERFAIIKSEAFFTELAWFLDGGIAYDDYKQLQSDYNEGLPPKLVFSTGVSARINLFGAMVIEPYYAFPLLKGASGKFGVFLVPGW